MTKNDFRELCAQRNFNDAQIEEFELAINHGLNINVLIALGPECPAESMHEVVLGMLHGVDVHIYAKNNFDSESMRFLRLGLESRCDIIPYADPRFSAEQLAWIYDGFMNNIPVDRYAKPEYSVEKMCRCYMAMVQYPEIFVDKDIDFDKFNELQLYQLTEACRQNIDLEPLLLEDYDDMQMQQICLGIRSDVDISVYASTEFNARQMNQIRLGLEHNAPISSYADHEFTAFQMKQIRLGLEQDLDVSIYANKEFSDKVMLLTRLGLLEGIEVSEYAVPGISDEDAEAIYDRLMALQTAIASENEGGFEVNSAYLDLVGLGDDKNSAALSEKFVERNTSIGIADPQYHQSTQPAIEQEIPVPKAETPVEKPTTKQQSAVSEPVEEEISVKLEDVQGETMTIEEMQHKYLNEAVSQKGVVTSENAVPLKVTI